MRYVSLMYHELYGEKPYNKFSVKKNTFCRQMDKVKELGLTTVDLYRDTEGRHGDVLITFDDGHATAYQAGSILRERGFVGVFYIIKDFSCASSSYLDVRQIRDLSDMGHMIGIHGKDHDSWIRKSPRQLIAELSDTKAWLEDVTGSAVITASAPGGFINKRVYRLIQEELCGVRFVRNSIPAHNSQLSPGVPINSFAIRDTTTISDFAKIVSGDVMFARSVLARYYLKELAKKAYFGLRNLVKGK